MDRIVFDFKFPYLDDEKNKEINETLNSIEDIEEEKIQKYFIEDLNNIFLSPPYNFSSPPEKIFNETIKHFILSGEIKKLTDLIKNAYFMEKLKNEKLEKDTLHIILQKNPKILIEIYDNKLYQPEYFPIYEKFIYNKLNILNFSEFKKILGFVIILINKNYIEWRDILELFSKNEKKYKLFNLLVITELMKEKYESHLCFILKNISVFINSNNKTINYGRIYDLGEELKINIETMKEFILNLGDELHSISNPKFVLSEKDVCSIDDITYKLLKGMFNKIPQTIQNDEKIIEKNIDNHEKYLKEIYKKMAQMNNVLIDSNSLKWNHCISATIGIIIISLVLLVFFSLYCFREFGNSQS